MTRFFNKHVQAAFAAFPPDARARLLELRGLVFEVADSLPGIGPIEESLRWGQPAYLTSSTRAGTTVRLGCRPDAPEHYSMFVHCQTSLIDGIRGAFPELDCVGNREVRFETAKPVPAIAGECIAMALTYHKPHLRQGGDHARRR